MGRTFAAFIIVTLVACAAIYKLREVLYIRRTINTSSAEVANDQRPDKGPDKSLESATEKSKDSCRPEALRLRWPLDGNAGKDWVIANYFDADPAIGSVRDFTGASGKDAATYDGHDGVDIEIPSFKTMDQGVSVVASADGIVDDAGDGAFDRNRVCTNEKWNFVTIRHANGFATTYGHLKKGSVSVRKGARVSTGAKLGLVGSSGCSSHPHVHIDVTDCFGKRIDMVKENMFSSMPPYSRSAPTDLMESYLFQPSIDEMEKVQSGTGDANLISIGHEFTAAMTAAYVHPGDIIRIDLLRPDNSDSGFFTERIADKFFPRSHWWGNFVLDEPGSWLVRFKVNGRMLLSRTITATD